MKKSLILINKLKNFAQRRAPFRETPQEESSLRRTTVWGLNSVEKHVILQNTVLSLSWDLVPLYVLPTLKNRNLSQSTRNISMTGAKKIVTGEKNRDTGARVGVIVCLHLPINKSSSSHQANLSHQFRATVASS